MAGRRAKEHRKAGARLGRQADEAEDQEQTPLDFRKSQR